MVLCQISANLIFLPIIMAKTVLFIRHAKSSWANPHLADIERPLNARGEKNGAEMARLIYKRYSEISSVAFISSPATRAVSTSQYFMDQWNTDKNQLSLYRQLYYGDEEDYIACLRGIEESTELAMVFGHNPSIEHLAARLKNPYIGDIPTCTVLCCEMKLPWQKASFDSIRLLYVLKPKDI